MIRIFIFLLTFVICSSHMYAQISEKDKGTLREAATNAYYESYIEGCSMYKIRKNNILTVTVSVPRKPRCQEIAKIKATNMMSKFLNGVHDSSESRYTVTDINENEFTNDSSASGNFVTESNESKQVVSNNSFTETICQRSMGVVKNLQCLKCINSSSSELIYIYYIVL